jgi:hypothetical protein
MFGHQGGSMYFDTATSTTNTNTRLGRYWRVKMTGITTKAGLNLQFKNMDVMRIKNGQQYVLLESSDGSAFGTPTELATATAANNGVIFTNVTLTHNRYYTIGTKVIAPGGVAAKLVNGLRASVFVDNTYNESFASPANQGKGIISFSIFTVDQGSYTNGKQTYPLYYTAEVRVGISPNVKECYTKDASFPNQTVTSVIINGVTFKKFITEEKHGDQYTNAASYRTVRNNSCYVLEQIQSGTKVKNDTMAIATSDGELASYYTTGEKIIKTFVFTK